MDADALAAGPLTSTRAAQVAVLVLVVALVVPLFFLSRMASNRPPDPSALKNVPRVRKDKADASGGGGKKGKAKKGAMERMRSDAAKGEGEEEDTATAGTAADGASDDDDEDDAKATRAAQRREAARERAEQREAEREFQDAKAATRRQKVRAAVGLCVGCRAERRDSLRAGGRLSAWPCQDRRTCFSDLSLNG
jgi:hypothetical protein